MDCPGRFSIWLFDPYDPAARSGRVTRSRRRRNSLPRKLLPAFFQVFGLPAFSAPGIAFQIPGITIRVAQECSGIHSSLVLVIASLLASHLLLRVSWRRALLIVFAIPAGVVRNGFRVFGTGLALRPYRTADD